MKTFAFKTYGDAYLFMGRLWAFCYSSDKYPHVTWNEKEITVYLYSPSFKGLSKREARVAAFLNDQYNMLKKSQLQREKVVSGVIAQATVEDMVGEEVKKHLAAREEERQRLVSEAVGGPVTWKELLLQQTTEEATEHKG